MSQLFPYFIVVVDLVKQSEKREREVIVGNEFRTYQQTPQFERKQLVKRRCYVERKSNRILLQQPTMEDH